MLRAPAQMPFINGKVLVVSRGMHGATQNIYTGLSDFSDCAFLLHLLREADLFVDIGSNVGVYTVLASACAGASSIAIEPIPQAFSSLCANIRANAIDDRATPQNIGLGRESEMLRFTVEGDCMNRVITEEHWTGPSIDVPVRTLDSVLAGQSPTLLKLDVEGWESEVLAGAALTLGNPSLVALIVEMDGSNVSFNPNEEAVHACLLSNGFAPFAYAPFKRSLTPLPSKNFGESNTLYLRDLERIEARLSSAPPFSVNGRSI